jgi:NAD(P)-dependent dehydrogenase (short-subunit alcohol dehydrogenase family)
VALVSRKQDALDAVTGDIRAHVPGARLLPLAAHVADDEATAAVLRRVHDELGPVRVLVNNAATNPYFGPLRDLDRGRADKTIEVNLWAPLRWTQLALQHGGLGSAGASSRPASSVVNVASIGGVATEVGIGWYNAAKAALIHLTRQLAVELAPAVRVNAVAPGLVRTQLARALWEPHEQEIAAALPLGRIGEPGDIADAITFLAGEGARWITGQTLVVDGGALVRPTVV